MFPGGAEAQPAMMLLLFSIVVLKEDVAKRLLTLAISLPSLQVFASARADVNASKSERAGVNGADNSNVQGGEEKKNKKTPAISAPRSLHVVTMTTASIPWRSCVFCHGISVSGRRVAVHVRPRAEPLSGPSPERPPSQKPHVTSERVASFFTLHSSPLIPHHTAIATRGSPRQRAACRCFLSAHPYMHAPPPSSSAGAFLHGEP